MSVAQATFNNILTLRKAFNVIATLHITSSLLPKPSCPQNGATYDYIIVGGGTSGCVIANRLTEDPNVNVLLLEAGDDVPLEGTYPGFPLQMNKKPFVWPYYTEKNEKYAQCHRSSNPQVFLGRMLGGTSALYYEYYQRGHRYDYDEWARIVNDEGWTGENVLPYFIKSEYFQDEVIRNSPAGKLHRYDGYLGVRTTRNLGNKNSYDYLQGFAQVGRPTVLDLNSMDSVGYTYLMITVANGTRQTSGLSFLGPIRNRKNLHVARNATVTKILFDENKTAVGVQVYTKCNNRTITLKARKEVILAAGTINSAKLLMLSGVGPKKELKNRGIPIIVDLPVGQNLKDHVSTIVDIVFTKTKFVKDPSQVKDYKEYTLPSTYGLIALNNTKEYPEYETINFFDDESIETVRYSVSDYQLKFDIVNKLYDRDVGKYSLYNIITHLAPKSTGSVTLRSCDPFEAPIVRLNYLRDPDDVKRLAMFVIDFLKVLDSPYFKEHGAKVVDAVGCRCDKYEKTCQEYWECFVSCIFIPGGHYIGTCALGSVVDGRLRVYGVKNLRVADGSIMPTLPTGDTAAPTYMIGEKAADMIKEDNKGGEDKDCC